MQILEGGYILELSLDIVIVFSKITVKLRKQRLPTTMYNIFHSQWVYIYFFLDCDIQYFIYSHTCVGRGVLSVCWSWK